MWALLPMAWRLGIIALSVVAVFGTIGGVVYKIKHDAVVVERAKVEQEKQDAIKGARDAKDTIRSKCSGDTSECLQSLDEWFRD